MGTVQSLNERECPKVPQGVEGRVKDASSEARTHGVCRAGEREEDEDEEEAGENPWPPLLRFQLWNSTCAELATGLK